MTATPNASIGPEHAAYVPRLLPGWAFASDALAHREIDASLVLFDISGFTRLTERLSRQGRAGAEDLSDVLHAVFTPLVAPVAQDEGSDLLVGRRRRPAAARRSRPPAPAVRAERGIPVCSAWSATCARPSAASCCAPPAASTPARPPRPRGDPAAHRELIVVGPAATAVCRVDAAAGAGQIVVSEETARALPSQLLGAAVPAGWLLARAVPEPETLPVVAPGVPPPELLATLLPPQLRSHLTQREREPSTGWSPRPSCASTGPIGCSTTAARAAGGRRRRAVRNVQDSSRDTGCPSTVRRRHRRREADAACGPRSAPRRRRPPGGRHPRRRRRARRAPGAAGITDAGCSPVPGPAAYADGLGDGVAWDLGRPAAALVALAGADASPRRSSTRPGVRPAGTTGPDAQGGARR